VAARNCSNGQSCARKQQAWFLAAGEWFCLRWRQSWTLSGGRICKQFIVTVAKNSLLNDLESQSQREQQLAEARAIQVGMLPPMQLLRYLPRL
jgi:hypothetical protein